MVDAVRRLVLGPLLEHAVLSGPRLIMSPR
jgi:hypothetical protein